MTTQSSPVYAFQKNPTMVDYPGHLSALFFLSGCNFTCGYCHNAELAKRQDVTLSWDKLKEVCLHFSEQWVDAAVVTGGEPTLSSNLPDLLKFLKSFGWKIKLDSNGSMPDVLEEVLPLVDYVAMDVKCPLEEYPAFAGFSDVDAITRSIGLIKQHASDYELRTTVIETIHSDEAMSAIASAVRGARRYVLQPFLPREDLPDQTLSALPRTSDKRLEVLQELLSDCADEVLISTQR